MYKHSQQQQQQQRPFHDHYTGQCVHSLPVKNYEQSSTDDG